MLQLVTGDNTDGDGVRFHPDMRLDGTKKRPYSSGPYEIAHEMV